MKKIFTLTTIALLSILGIANAQQMGRVPVIKDKTVIRCYTVQAMEEARKRNPAAETEDQFEAWMSAKLSQRRAARTSVVNYTLPVIFHVISAGEAVGTAPNIDASFMKAQIIALNQTYGNQLGSPYAVSANSGLQFALAEKNPSGVTLAEPGVDRINYSTKGWTNYATTNWTSTYIDATVKPASIWDPTKYINVWLISDFYSAAGDALLGYATFPTGSTLTGLSGSESATTAGVVIVTGSVGSSYTKSTCDPNDGYYVYNMGKTMVHEMGHFFGLRHIWGDATCGTDYCGDTPVHETANYGAPSHPKTNSCGTADEMFENYMDYSDDIVLNTFTTDQVSRMQTVMINSPRRKELPTSVAGFVPVTASNNIAFIDYCDDSLQVSEKGVTVTGTQSYRDINLSITAEDKATDVGSVSFILGGTAVSGVDYTIVNPTINFATGDATKTVTVRILDNAAVDGTRKIILTLVPTGPGISASSSHQSISINILDDDNIQIGQLTNSIKLLNESFETGAVGWTVGRSSSTYPNRFTVSANGSANGTGMCAHVTNDATNRPNVYTRGTSGYTLLGSPLIDASSVESVGSLSFKYKVRGRGTVTNPSDYGMLYYYDGSGFNYWGTSSSATGYGPYCTNAAAGISNTPNIAAPVAITSSTKFNVYFVFFTGTSTTGGDPGLNVDDVVLTATPFKIESAISSSSSFSLKSALLNNFRSGNKKQIIAINNSTENVDGVSATVYEAGNDQVAITTEAIGPFSRSRKVVGIMPATPNTTATYTATIYFTQAEITAWGTDMNTVQVMQVDNNADLFGMLSPANAKLITPTVTDKLATDGYIAYTFTTTGFGKFVIVSPSTLLPLKLNSFTGALKNNIVNLKWNTTNEANTKGFDIEKSTNGADYQVIGFTKGLNGVRNEYGFNDEKVLKGNKYYYRLKMIDQDGKFNYSNVVTITIVDKDKWFTVYPSPVKAVLFIQNNTATTQAAEITITEVSGKVVYKHAGMVAGKLEIPVTNWSNGTYFVKIKSNDTESTLKVVKQ